MSTTITSAGARRDPPTRRRFLAILAAGAALPALPSSSAGFEARGPAFEWRGQALGAEARIVLAHPDIRLAEAMVEHCLDEIRRLERIFSLHAPESELVRLNRAGRLTHASHDLRRVLAEADLVTRASGGAFDVTMQPLWQLYAGHFRRLPDDLRGPGRSRLDEALARVGRDGLEIDGASIALRRPGMAVTLNGIAQGYITDRVAGLLRAGGFEKVLLQTGETFALAPARDQGWRVAIQDPARAGGVVTARRLSNRAIATSRGQATPFDVSGHHHHLLDPRTGRSADRYASVSVIADRAVVADAASTALSLLPLPAAAGLLGAIGGGEAVFVFANGGWRSVRA